MFSLIGFLGSASLKATPTLIFETSRGFCTQQKAKGVNY